MLFDRWCWRALRCAICVASVVLVLPGMGGCSRKKNAAGGETKNVPSQISESTESSLVKETVSSSSSNAAEHVVKEVCQKCHKKEEVGDGKKSSQGDEASDDKSHDSDVIP